MMKSINHDDFERARTPEKLKEIFDERDGLSYMLGELCDLVLRLTDGDGAEFVDQEFKGEVNNGEVYFQLEQKGYETIGAGLELISLVELWRGRHELGDDAILVERHGFTKIGVMAVKDGQVTVQYNDVAGSVSVSEGEPTKLARRILRSASSIRLQTALQKVA